MLLVLVGNLSIKRGSEVCLVYGHGTHGRECFPVHKHLVRLGLLVQVGESVGLVAGMFLLVITSTVSTQRYGMRCAFLSFLVVQGGRFPVANFFDWVRSLITTVKFLG